MMRNLEETKTYFYRTLNCLEDLLTNVSASEQLGYLKKAHIRKIKKEIVELNRLICELITPQRLLLH